MHGGKGARLRAAKEDGSDSMAAAHDLTIAEAGVALRDGSLSRWR